MTADDLNAALGGLTEKMMAECFVLVAQGVYRHAIWGPFFSEPEARAHAEKLTVPDPDMSDHGWWDGHHDLVMLKEGPDKLMVPHLIYRFHRSRYSRVHPRRADDERFWAWGQPGEDGSDRR